MSLQAKGEKADLIIAKIGFPYSCRVKACGFLGGMWLCWRENIQVQ
ncbi:hypothetical protein Gogos_012706, partial [Gossypium gossypioides]|nr:hypothetical protein [Gossypium gossypioides]